jgi:hypothetical protein
MPSQNYSVDALIEDVFEDTFDTDAILIVRKTQDDDVDAVVVRRLLETFTIDPITIGTLENEPLVDGLLSEEDKETTFLIDGVPQLVPESRPRVDAFLQDTFDLDYLVDARVILQPNQNFTLDASLQKAGFQPFNVDAFLLDVFGQLTQVDAILELPQGDIDVCTIHFCTPTQPVLFYSVDAIVIESTPFEFTVDAHIEKVGFFHNFSLDALLVTGRETTFTLDASLILPSQFNACPSITRQSLNCVSVIRRRGT